MIEITLELEDGEWAATVKSSVPSSITAYSGTKLGALLNLEELVVHKKCECIVVEKYETFKMIAKLISDAQKETADD